MNAQPFIENTTGFLKFLSTTYGTGNAPFDLLMVSGCFLCFIVFIGILRAMTSSKEHDDQDLGEIQSTVDSLQIQLSELRSGVISELEKWRGELGYLKQELKNVSYRRENPVPTVEVQQTNKDQENDLTSLFRR